MEQNHECVNWNTMLVTKWKLSFYKCRIRLLWSYPVMHYNSAIVVGLLRNSFLNNLRDWNIYNITKVKVKLLFIYIYLWLKEKDFSWYNLNTFYLYRINMLADKDKILRLTLTVCWWLLWCLHLACVLSWLKFCWLQNTLTTIVFKINFIFTKCWSQILLRVMYCRSNAQ